MKLFKVALLTLTLIILNSCGDDIHCVHGELYWMLGDIGTHVLDGDNKPVRCIVESK